MPGRKVEIVVTSTVVGQYEARSYPDSQIDATGAYSLYRVPVYRIQIKGTDVRGLAKTVDFMAPRFMPYYNDPQRPDPHYSARGWVNAGLSAARTVVVSTYKRDYEVRNRYSPGRGAIVVHAAFYVHAGPASLQDVGFGSAGCIEIIGNYDDFKKAITDLSGLTGTLDAAIQQLVNEKKLTVHIQAAAAPDIRKNLTRKIRD